MTEAYPSTFREAILYFADLDRCNKFVARLRWPDGPVCPRCDGRSHSYIRTRYLWKCLACKYQFSAKVGTIFEDSAIPLNKWLAAIWLIANTDSVSSHELGRLLWITQKSAWLMLKRIGQATSYHDAEAA